ncbi:tyrosine-protein phosphatase [Paeniglutamicibacter sp. ABSL32-1]|uniref:tyrosine-protein phosphatase n=1 Tax=Paeniglutamicibacter quisquiliarum TaxID=2849498 RepID=UPI001C2D8372|nr:tyrosine-protein phosphatase [Paeniglutamicibacter quisquiliarum]MBV1777627.1 tyrosine-protein phosphatase [Paeniglutamicibacter quisquiliarum]
MSRSMEAATAVPNLRRVPSAGDGRLFRSAAPSGLERAGIRELDALGVRTVVDLREPFEVAERRGYVPAGAVHVSVPLYLGPLPVATAIEDVYCHLIADRGTEITKAVGAIAAGLPEGVLVHCAAGKDRTGLVVALVLEVAGVPRQILLGDYARSARDLPASYRERVNLELACALGDSAELQAALHLHLDSPAAVLDDALDMVEARYGSAACYLLAHGLDPADLTVIREELAGPGAAEEAGPDV